MTSSTSLAESIAPFNSSQLHSSTYTNKHRNVETRTRRCEQKVDRRREVKPKENDCAKRAKYE
jgi:hypothetical protein